ncbi:hypothetical protein [Lacticaseibacillus jixiensis]|uniref:hypothetical protein n=1 Tax=Lacticaseibacillus jixiensis TaxID=3231926 RepID=UPI0036F422EE
MNTKHKVLLMAASAVMAVSAFGLVGCGKKSSNDSSSKNQKLTVWTQFATPATSAKTWHDSPWHAGYAKATGIAVDWKFPAKGNTGDQAFNLITAQKDLPDIMGYSFMDKADQYIKQGIIRDLTPDIKKKAPNYWAYLQAHPDFAKAMRTDSGKYYMFGYTKQYDWMTSWQGPIINKTYLDKLGMKEPTNIKEWDAYLVAAKKKFGATLTTQGVASPGFAGAFGAYGTSALNYYVDNGKVKVPQTSKNWKDLMTWYASLYKRGLIDKDFETLDGEGLATKVAKGKVAATIGSGADVGNWNDTQAKNKTASRFEAVGYPKQADGAESASIFGGNKYSANGFAISTSCPESKLDEAFKWMDYAFSKKGIYYWNYGIKGESYNIKNGKVVLTDKVTNNPRGIGEGRFLYGEAHNGAGVQLAEGGMLTKPDTDGSKIWYASGKGYMKKVMPAVTLTNAESKTAASLENTISTYLAEQTSKFITGKQPINDSTYKALIDRMNKDGLQKDLKIRQAAYDRFQKR